MVCGTASRVPSPRGSLGRHQQLLAIFWYVSGRSGLGGLAWVFLSLIGFGFWLGSLACWLGGLVFGLFVVGFFLFWLMFLLAYVSVLGSCFGLGALS